MHRKQQSCIPITTDFHALRLYLCLQLKIVEFANEDSLLELSLDLEKSYANAFTYGFLGLAHKELYPSEDDKWELFKMGLRFGMCLILLVWFCWNCIFDPSEGINLFNRPIINLYLSWAGFLLLIWFWGVNLVVWQRINVDYAAILGFRKEKMYSPKEIFSDISTVTICYLGNILLYYKMLRGVAGKSCYYHFLHHETWLYPSLTLWLPSQVAWKVCQPTSFQYCCPSL